MNDECACVMVPNGSYYEPYGEWKWIYDPECPKHGHKADREEWEQHWASVDEIFADFE